MYIVYVYFAKWRYYGIFGRRDGTKQYATTFPHITVTSEQKI